MTWVNNDRQGHPSADMLFGWIFICAAFFLRLFTYASTKFSLSGDAYSYLEKARTIANTGRLPSLSTQPSGYPLVISHLLVSDPTQSVERIARTQQLMDLLIVIALIFIAWWRLARHPFLVRCLTAVFLLMQPFTATMSFQIYTEQMVMFFTFFGVIVVSLGLGCSNLWPTLLLLASGSALLGVAAIMRPDVLVLNVFVLLLAAFLIRQKSLRKRTATLSALLLPFLIAPLSTLILQLTSTGELGLVHRDLHHSGYFGWLRTWPSDSKEYAQHAFFKSPGIPFSGAQVDAYPPKAFGSSIERGRVSHLLERWRTTHYDHAVDSGFQALADSRLRTHPLQYFLLNPVYRMLHFWLNVDGTQFYLIPFQVPFPRSTLMVASVTLARLSLLILFFVGLSRVFTPAFPYDSALLRLSAGVVILRTLELGILGLTNWGGLMEIRYVIIGFPFLIVVAIYGIDKLTTNLIQAENSPSNQ
jgi:hypothetical protein